MSVSRAATLFGHDVGHGMSPAHLQLRPVQIRPVLLAKWVSPNGDRRAKPAMIWTER